MICRERGVHGHLLPLWAMQSYPEVKALVCVECGDQVTSQIGLTLEEMLDMAPRTHGEATREVFNEAERAFIGFKPGPGFAFSGTRSARIPGDP